MKEDYDEFAQLLEDSWRDVWFVSQWLSGKGYHARVVPGMKTPNPEQRMEYTDDGDIEITKRVEVKHWPEIDFQSLDDVPYENVIVDEAYKVRKFHRNTLEAYFILNASRTGCLVIPRSTVPKWFERKLPDKNEPEPRLFTMVPKKFVTYMKLR